VPIIGREIGFSVVEGIMIQPDFDSIKQTDPYGHEFWSARELMPLLGYDRWQNFEKAIERAKIACEESGDDVSRCFTDASKTSDMPTG
jgi:DNA-damage-inducible protein D